MWFTKHLDSLGPDIYTIVMRTLILNTLDSRWEHSFELEFGVDLIELRLISDRELLLVLLAVAHRYPDIQCLVPGFSS